MKRFLFAAALAAWGAAACAPPGAPPPRAPETAGSSAHSSAGGASATTGFSAAVPVTWALAEHAEGPGCFGLSRADELLCRADRRVIQARAAGNEKLVACYRRKGSELRTAYRIAEESRERIRANGEAAMLAKERLSAAEQALERDYASLEGCAGPVGKEPDSVRVIVPPLPNDAALPAARWPNDSSPNPRVTTVF